LHGHSLFQSTGNRPERKKAGSSFFAQISAAIGELNCNDQRPRIRISISGDTMTPNHDRLGEELSTPDDVSRPEGEAPETAKARQDLSHQKLDQFIAAALAELNDDERAA
jgi:hypothetical protein